MIIAGTGSALPERVVTNDDLKEFLDTSDEWISERTGIRSRHVLTKENLTTLGAQAAQKALAAAGRSAGEIDYLILATVHGDYVTPSMSAAVAGEIGAACPAMDLNSGCCGFLYALDMAGSLIESGRAARVLIVAADAVSRMADWTDRATCVLFGDGASAAVLEKGGNTPIFHGICKPDTQSIRMEVSSGNSPYIQPTAPEARLSMKGQDVYRFAVSTVPQVIGALLEKAGITADEVDLFVLHQANKRIIDSVRTRLQQPEEKFPVNIAQYGNTSGASVGILLDEMTRAGAFTGGKKVVLCAFGAGLLCHAAYMEI